MEPKTRIIAEEGKQELVIIREFDLPVELVYKAYTEAEFLEQWMGTKMVELDNRNHGSFRMETSHNGKVVFSAHGTIHSVTPDKQIVRTFEMEHMTIGVQLEFLEFESITETTSKLTIQVIYRSEQHRAEQLKLPFAYGLNMAHDRLENFLKNKS